MIGFFHFLRCFGRAAVKNAARALASMVPLGEVVFEITRDAEEEYRKDKITAALREKPTPPPNPLPETERGSQKVSAVCALAQCNPSVVLLPSPLRGGVGGGVPRETVNGTCQDYTVHSLLAVGDVADVHLASTTGDAGPAESRYFLKIARAPEGNLLLDNERRTLKHLGPAAGKTVFRWYLPRLVESFQTPGPVPKRVNVYPADPGFYTLEQVHEQHPALDGRHLAWIFKRLLSVLGFSHGQGIVHGAVLPCHVLIHAADHGLRLVGWGQSVESGRRITVLAPRYRDWYPLEVLNKQPATPETDLFLAARCLIYLAGGDPVRDRMPDSVPAPMQRFLATCLLEGPRMRPGDAWKLMDEFDELLRQLYGPPKFQPLTMT